MKEQWEAQSHSSKLSFPTQAKMLFNLENHNEGHANGSKRPLTLRLRN